ncbi:TPA: hypothetical protein DDW35_01585 [Candidatus Sumerlaeota bacterium]|nr:hypothetical protein [Candidatus Sumerlaeota bacterium]
MTLISEKGTASGQIDFIEKLYEFISSNASTIGWNALELTTISSQRQATIQIGSECYFTFSSATDDTTACRLYFRAHTSFTSGVVWKSQSGGAEIRGDSNNCGNQAISAPISSTFAYYFYADTNYFIFILSIPTGILSIGNCRETLFVWNCIVWVFLERHGKFKSMG